MRTTMLWSWLFLHLVFSSQAEILEPMVSGHPMIIIYCGWSCDILWHIFTIFSHVPTISTMKILIQLAVPALFWLSTEWEDHPFTTIWGEVGGPSKKTHLESSWFFGCFLIAIVKGTNPGLELPNSEISKSLSIFWPQNPSNMKALNSQTHDVNIIKAWNFPILRKLLNSEVSCVFKQCLEHLRTIIFGWSKI